jgi:adenosylmethionine-8-amino-7-oxononanoate aminotransferase
MKLTEREAALLRRTFLDYRLTDEFLQEPLIISRAERLSYWDRDGRRFVDGIGGIFVAGLGHRHPRVLDAVRSQMDRLTFAPPLHGIADVTLDLVERLGTVAPAGMTFVKPFSGGSESVEAALKFVRQYVKQAGRPGKYKVISRYLGYHGGTFGAMGASGTGKRRTPFEPQMPGFVKVHPPTHYRGQFATWDECNRFAARQVEDAILAEDPDTVAAVILEPVGNTGGIITPTAEYYRIIREACTRHAVILIFDEIITGFGRCGAMFAAQALDVTPDIICSGKGLTSGVIPAGAMIARQDMAEVFQGTAGREFAHGHTFAGHPLACAAGIAVIDELVEKELPARAVELGARLAAGLEKLKRHGVVREVRGRGLLRGVELVRDTASNAPFPELGTALKKTSLARGLVMRVDPSWFALAPALIATKEEIDEILDLVEKSFADALAAVGR